MSFLKDFLFKIPKMPLHYCRAETTKLYLEPMFRNYADLFKEYQALCSREGKKKEGFKRRKRKTKLLLNFEKCIIFSDGCKYQNRNAVMATALRHFCATEGKVVEQKFLEKGYTQMEVDSVHATFENKIKGAEIHLPSDYIRLMKEARTNPKPHDVEYLSHSFFRNYKDFGALKSITPGKRVDDANVTDIRALQYCPDGNINYKLHFKDDWKPLPLARCDKIQEGNPKQLYTARLRIKKTKFDHLQSMKSVILSDAHAFYDALPH